MPSITQLEYVLAVDEHRHFGKAAQACHVSQPSLSMQLQKLEDELDIVLFDRTRKPVLPTERGKRFIQQAKTVINEYKRLLSIAKDKSNELQGKFKLAVIPTLSPYLLPLFLQKFCIRYPKVELTIEEYKTEEILELLKKDEIDAALAVTPLNDDQIIERTLFYEPFFLYCSKNHPCLDKKSIKAQDLNPNQIWLLNEGHCFRNQVLQICGVKGHVSPMPQLNFESGNLETLKNIVKEMGGYTLLPYLATQNLSPKEIKERLRPFSRPIPTREVALIHSRMFLKEDIIVSMEKMIIESLPNGVMSNKRGDINIIDID